MALLKASSAADQAPQSPDYGDSEQQNAPAPNAANSPPMVGSAQNSASTFGTKAKTEETYIKVRLSKDPTTKETWLKQVKVHENNIREFSDTKAGVTAFINPLDAGLLIYSLAESKNYLLGFKSPDQKNGLLGRVYLAQSKATPEKPNPKPYMGGKYHAEGLLVNGKPKEDAIFVFANIIGKDSAAIMALISENKVRLDALRAQNENQNGAQGDAAPATATSARTSGPSEAALKADQDLDFGM